MKILVSQDTKSQIYQDAVKIRHQVFEIEQKVPHDLEIDEFENVCSHFVLYDEQGKAQATVRLLPDKEGKMAILQRMAVYQDVRSKGYGRMTVLEFERYAKEQGFEKIELHAQLSAELFYEKLGYLPFGEVFEDAGIDHISMEKRI